MRRFSGCRRLQIAIGAAAQVLVALLPAAEAVVIHAHGLLRAHLHFVSGSDLESGAARSSGFDHLGSCRDQAAVENVGVLVVVLNSTISVSNESLPRGLFGTQDTELSRIAAVTPVRKIRPESSIPGGPMGHPSTSLRSSAAVLMTSHAFLV